MPTEWDHHPRVTFGLGIAVIALLAIGLGVAPVPCTGNVSVEYDEHAALATSVPARMLTDALRSELSSALNTTVLDVAALESARDSLAAASSSSQCLAAPRCDELAVPPALLMCDAPVAGSESRCRTVHSLANSVPQGVVRCRADAAFNTAVSRAVAVTSPVAVSGATEPNCSLALTAGNRVVSLSSLVLLHAQREAPRACYDGVGGAFCGALAPEQAAVAMSGHTAAPGDGPGWAQFAVDGPDLVIAGITARSRSVALSAVVGIRDAREARSTLADRPCLALFGGPLVAMFLFVGAAVLLATSSVACALAACAVNALRDVGRPTGRSAPLATPRPQSEKQDAEEPAGSGAAPRQRDRNMSSDEDDAYGSEAVADFAGASSMGLTMAASAVEDKETRKPLISARGSAVLVVSLGFLERALRDEDADQKAGTFLSDVSSAAVVHEGHVSFATANEVLVTFNSVTPAIEHEAKAAALIDTLREKDSIRTCTMTACSGTIVCNVNPKHPTVFGPCIDAVRCLQRLQVVLEIPAAAPEPFVFAAERQLRSRAVPADIVQLPDQPAETLFELLAAPYAGDVEALLAAIALLRKCEFRRAAQKLEALGNPTWAVERLIARCNEAIVGGHLGTTYSRKYVGWDHGNAAAADVHSQESPVLPSTGSRNDSGDASGGADKSSGAPFLEVQVQYDGMPVEFVGAHETQWMRSDKVIGNVRGATQYAGMSEAGSPVAILAADQHKAENAAFVAEARQHVALASRLDHPGVVTVHTAVVANARWVMVVEEYLPGGDLAWFLREFTPLPATAVRRLSRELVTVLRHLQHRQVAHCGINHTNLRVSLDGTLRLVWFAHGADLRSPSPPQGGIAAIDGVCLAPELRAGRAAHPRTDMYSFGVILATLFTGVGALPARIATAEEGAATVLTQLAAADVPQELRDDLTDLVQRCLELDADQRISADEVAFHRYFSSSAASA